MQLASSSLVMSQQNLQTFRIVICKFFLPNGNDLKLYILLTSKCRQGPLDMEVNSLDIQYNQSKESIGISESILGSRVEKGKG